MTGGAVLVLLSLSVYKQNSEALVQERDGLELDKADDGLAQQLFLFKAKAPRGATSIFTQNEWWKHISPPDCSCYADKTKNAWDPVDNRCFTPTYQSKTYYCNEGNGYRETCGVEPPANGVEVNCDAAWNGVTKAPKTHPRKCDSDWECPFSGWPYSKCVGIKRDQRGWLLEKGRCHYLTEKGTPAPIDATWFIGHNCCFSQCRYKGSFEVFDPHITGFKEFKVTGGKEGGFTLWKDQKSKGWTNPLGKPTYEYNNPSTPNTAKPINWEAFANSQRLTCNSKTQAADNLAAKAAGKVAVTGALGCLPGGAQCYTMMGAYGLAGDVALRKEYACTKCCTQKWEGNWKGKTCTHREKPSKNPWA